MCAYNREHSYRLVDQPRDLRTSTARLLILRIMSVPSPPAAANSGKLRPFKRWNIESVSATSLHPNNIPGDLGASA
jgi:hypothetical protein